jgi:hypothetical protein
VTHSSALQVAGALDTTALSCVNVLWFFWLMEETTFRRGWFFLFEGLLDYRIEGTWDVLALIILGHRCSAF